MNSELTQYEIAYLISPNVKEEEVFGEAGKITGFIQEANGFIGHIEEPRRKRLAYPINKSLEAYFGWTQFSALPEKVAEIEKKLKLEKSLTRYLIVHAETEPARPRFTKVRKTEEETPSHIGAETKPEEKMNMEELDKQLEEILKT